MRRKDVRTKQAVCSALIAVCAAAMMAQGCGSKKEDLTPSSWANPQYRISATHPAVWAVKDFNTVEDPRTGAVLLAIFRTPGPGRCCWPSSAR